MEINVKEKADALVLLSDYPSLLIWFLVILVIVIAGTIIITVSKSNPNLFNNWLHFKKKTVPENERRQNKRRKDDRDDKPPIVDEICNDCVKSSVMAIQTSINNISETLKTMNLQIERATINAGLAATGGDLALTDWLRIVFDLWRKGVNGNTVSATKIKIMKENGLKTWNSELSYNRHKYKEVNKHFQDCVKKIEDGLR